MRMFEQAGLEAFRLAGFAIAHHARQEPHNSIEQHDGRSLSARQDVIADRNFLEIARFNDALIHAFETTAQNDRARPVGQFAHALLCQRFSARAHQEHRAATVGD